MTKETHEKAKILMDKIEARIQDINNWDRAHGFANNNIELYSNTSQKKIFFMVNANTISFELLKAQSIIRLSGELKALQAEFDNL
jgi:hypothetical protein